MSQQHHSVVSPIPVFFTWTTDRHSHPGSAHGLKVLADKVAQATLPQGRVQPSPALHCARVESLSRLLFYMLKYFFKQKGLSRS